MRYLPPLNALKAFYAAAQHRNFSDAAEALHVTHGAVSRHIRQLEDVLGVQLFRRLPRGVELTEEGRALSFAVQSGFEIIADAVEVYHNDRGHRRVTVSTVPSIAARWFVPRLEEFHKKEPDIEIRISTTTALVDLRRDGVDFVIRFGSGKWPGLETELLFSRDLTTVCSPDLLAQFNGPPCYECLRDFRLLVSDGHRFWEAWLKGAGAEHVRPKSVLQLDDANVTIQAAIAGQGIALIPEVLVREDIDAGRLVRPFPEQVDTEMGYFLAWREGHPPGPHAVKVMNMIREAAGRDGTVMDTALLP